MSLDGRMHFYGSVSKFGRMRDDEKGIMVCHSLT